MDTKIQALEKAQKRAIGFVENGDTVRMIKMNNSFTVIAVDDDGTKIEHVFDFADPKPLEKDTLCLCDDGIMRYAIGEFDANGINRFYAPGCCSKNIEKCQTLFSFTHFEIIETPREFERVQTPDEHCIYFGCSKYINKWQRVESDKFLSGDCEKCTVPIGTPSNIKTRK